MKILWLMTRTRPAQGTTMADGGEAVVGAGKVVEGACAVAVGVHGVVGSADVVPRTGSVPSPAEAVAVGILVGVGVDEVDAKKQLHDGLIDLCSYGSDITNASVIALAKHCPGLTQINLTGCIHITDTSVIALAEDCPELTWISLDGCIHITGTSLIALAEDCPGLVWISLDGCTHITDTSVMSLAENCPGLTGWIGEKTAASVKFGEISPACLGQLLRKTAQD